MRLAILSRNKKLFSIRRLLTEAKKAGIECDVLNPLECQLVIGGTPIGADHSEANLPALRAAAIETTILYRAKVLPRYDAVLPRIGASITEYGLSVVKHFEVQGIGVVNGSRPIADSRNKMRSLQILSSSGLLVPATVMTRSTRGLRTAVEAVKGLPVVLKVLQGTQGVGVMLVHTPISLGSVLDTLRTLDQDVIIQQFIVEGAGKDFRVLVIGDRVVASMMRTAPHGEFRSNIHRGGEANEVDLPPSFHTAAIKAAKVLGLQVAGVDIMESNDGPMIIEVNSSPGFEGIEKATGINVAKEIMRQVRKTAKETKARKSKSRA